MGVTGPGRAATTAVRGASIDTCRSGPRAPVGEGAVVELLRPARDLVPRVLRLDACPRAAAELHRPSGVVEDALEDRAERSDVARRDVPPHPLDELAVVRDVARHRAGAVPHRLQERDGESLDRRRKDERERMRVQLGAEAAADAAGEHDAPWRDPPELLLER